ncbi:hypothetical protein GobsT_35950 [Gemmata obscuriglobus]|nr:hypothetical protein GobsT_35950 [Gemmata obscuriglobus]VTS07184.1 Uncharacterized protein OS=Tolypothrix bouteillei VB521301 GN=DA73_000000131540 PE=4 SV=1 [Gemmata obscuriglobus UQM 2246]
MAREEKNGAPEERRRGDCWDHVALDPEHRLVVSLVVGQRTEEATHALVRDAHRRIGASAHRRTGSCGSSPRASTRCTNRPSARHTGS